MAEPSDIPGVVRSLIRLDSDQPPMVLDVRKDGEYQAGHLRNSEHVFLGELPDQAGQFVSEDKPVVTFCGSGRRARIAASILRRKGVANVANSLGSMAACKAIGCEIEL